MLEQQSLPGMLWISSYRPFFLFLILALGCTSDPVGKEQAISESSNISTPTLKIRSNEAVLFEAPNLKSKILQDLPKHASVIHLEQLSYHLDWFNMEGQEVFEPWIAIQTKQQVNGWTNLGAVYDLNRLEDQEEYYQKMLEALAGAELYPSIVDYNRMNATVKTADDFLTVYKQAQTIQSELTKRLQLVLEQNSHAKIPDFFWLQEVLPGLLPQFDQSNKQYLLDKDFTDFLNTALKTSSKKDDQFIAVFLLLFPEDSIEYKTPSYQLPVSLTAQHSLLGRGIHLDLLIAMEEVVDEAPLFFAQVQPIKDALINDISSANVSYWESADQIIEELKRIQAKDFDVLSQNDKIAIGERIKQFEKFTQFGISVDLKSGRE